MGVWLGLLVVVATVLGMEIFAYAVHRWVMHGPGWFLHRSHHEPRLGLFERNDWFAVIFAFPSIVGIFMTTQLGLHPIWLWIGIGIAAYGAIYFIFHDILVHQRMAHRYVPRSAYMKRLVQAHRLHHAVETKHGTVSFGFLYAPPIRALKAQLARNAQARLRGPR